MDKVHIIPSKHTGPFALLPPAPGTCPECAADHPLEYPHNQQSLFYQYKFFNDHGRWPTWEDAMAHCCEAIQSFWRAALEKRGVRIS